MTDKKFIWLLAPGEARNGRKLETGETYSVGDFRAEVVEEWVRTGAAKYAAAAKTKSGGEE